MIASGTIFDEFANDQGKGKKEWNEPKGHAL